MRFFFIGILSVVCLFAVAFHFSNEAPVGRSPASYYEEAYGDGETTGGESNAPLTSLRPILRPEINHNCGVTNCTRDSILAMRKVKNCATHILGSACEYSPWREKHIKTRFRSVIQAVQKYNRLHGWNVDPNAILCIFGKEGAGLDPLMLNFGSCKLKKKATDTGLGQVTGTTAGDMICRGFVPKHPDFKNFRCPVSPDAYAAIPPGDRKIAMAFKAGYPYVNKLLAYPEAQIEMSMQVLRDKVGVGIRKGAPKDAGNLTWQNFKRYNASNKATSYANSVNSCYKKLKGRNPYSNLSRLNEHYPVTKQYNDIMSRCGRENSIPPIRPRSRPKVRPKDRGDQE